MEKQRNSIDWCCVCKGPIFLDEKIMSTNVNCQYLSAHETCWTEYAQGERGNVKLELVGPLILSIEKSQ